MNAAAVKKRRKRFLYGIAAVRKLKCPQSCACHIYGTKYINLAAKNGTLGDLKPGII